MYYLLLLKKTVQSPAAAYLHGSSGSLRHGYAVPPPSRREVMYYLLLLKKTVQSPAIGYPYLIQGYQQG